MNYGWATHKRTTDEQLTNEQRMNKSQMNNGWTTHKWTTDEQLTNEQRMNNAQMNNRWTTHKWTTNEQLTNEQRMNKSQMNNGWTTHNTLWEYSCSYIIAVSCLTLIYTDSYCVFNNGCLTLHHNILLWCNK